MPGATGAIEGAFTRRGRNAKTARDTLPKNAYCPRYCEARSGIVNVTFPEAVLS